MNVTYQWCRASDEGDPAGYVIATDYQTDTLAWMLEGTEAQWLVPNTETED